MTRQQVINILEKFLIHKRRNLLFTEGLASEVDAFFDDVFAPCLQLLAEMQSDHLCLREFSEYWNQLDESTLFQTGNLLLNFLAERNFVLSQFIEDQFGLVEKRVESGFVLSKIEAQLHLVLLAWMI